MDYPRSSASTSSEANCRAPARVPERPEYKHAGGWRIVDPRVWNTAQVALAGRRKRAA
jgi:hypothetical protein